MRIFDRDLGNLSRRDFLKMVLGSGIAVTGLVASEILNPVTRTTMHAMGGGEHDLRDQISCLKVNTAPLGHLAK